jgi:hypothetical protein
MENVRDHPATAVPSGNNPPSVPAIANWSIPVYAAILGASMIGTQTRVFLSGTTAAVAQGCPEGRD